MTFLHSQDAASSTRTTALAEDAFTSEGGRVDAHPLDERVDARRSMAEFGITQRGRFFLLRGYRYDRLEDATAYAHVLQMPGHEESRQDREIATPDPAVDEQAPDASARSEMERLGVSSIGGRFCFKEFRYDRLADALAYAERYQCEESR